MFGLITITILKRVRQGIFLKKRFIERKVRGGKEVAKSLMVFNLRKIIHLIQSKKYLRT